MFENVKKSHDIFDSMSSRDRKVIEDVSNDLAQVGRLEIEDELIDLRKLSEDGNVKGKTN